MSERVIECVARMICEINGEDADELYAESNEEQWPIWRSEISKARAILAALASADAETRAELVQAVLGDGWVAVPREPTEAMLDAAAKAAGVQAGDIEAWDMWSTMLAAAAQGPSDDAG